MYNNHLAPFMEKEIIYMQAAIQRSADGMRRNEGGPFGAIIVKDGIIVGAGNNRVLATNDPTAHAEVVAIREACKNLNTFQLTDCVLYTSCEPCPMCLGAIYWARPKAVYFGCTKEDAAEIGFDDQFIYGELEVPFAARQIPMKQLLHDEAKKVFAEWAVKPDKTPY